VSVFAKRTSFVASYREFLLPGVERCVTGYFLKEWHVASKREKLARAFVTAALAGQ
jgi:hypothetical protein